MFNECSLFMILLNVGHFNYVLNVIRGPTKDIIHYFTLMSSELHYLDIILKIEYLQKCLQNLGKIACIFAILPVCL